MKYFAVTDDPNELMHYGIKGMKWGVIRTDAQLGHPNKPSMKKPKLNSLLTKPLSDRDRQAIIAGTYVKTNNAKSSRSSVPHSPAYISASSKLRKIMKSGIDKAKASWDNYNSPKARSERMFQKHVQLARQGRLKYKGISDKEVERITDRLALERQARNLSGSEKPSYIRRVFSAMGEGAITGIGQGVANRMSERISRGGKLKTQRMMNEQTAEFNRQQARENFKRSRREKRILESDADRNMARDAQREVDKEYYKMAAEQGIDTGLLANIRGTRINIDEYGRPIGISLASGATRAGRAKALRDYNDAEKEKKRIEENEDWGRSLRRKQYESYYTTRAKNLATIDYPTKNNVKSADEIRDAVSKKQQQDIKKMMKEQYEAQQAAAKARAKEQAKASGNDRPQAYARPHGNQKRREAYRNKRGR